MATISITARDGSVTDYFGQIGLSLMENIRNAGHDDLLAMCGGRLSCATCHVYVDKVPDGASLPALSADEDDLLSGLDHRQANSRLSCQIPLADRLNGIAVTIAPDE